MSQRPIAAMSGLSLFGGIFAFTKYSSFPALFLSFGIAAASATSAMRIRDGMDWGYEGAAASSGALMAATIRRTLITRAPIPATLALISTATTGYYLKAISDYGLQH
ncbi:hypothetical protein JCM24511_01055 [Saitozyma sp. JCM 24511]|nr:hypothetical protein JCM24511_01055 [Saitozyma sp. JCM 24511]